MTADAIEPESSSSPLALPPILRGSISPKDVREAGGDKIPTLRGKDGLRIESVNFTLRKMRGNAHQWYNRRLERLARWELYLAMLPFGSEEYQKVEDRIDKLTATMLKLCQFGDSTSEKITATAMAAGLDVGLPSTAPRVDAEVSDAREDDEARA